MLPAYAVRPGVISALSLTLVLGSFLSQTSRAADNGLAQAPLRGWSTWSALEGAFDEKKIKAEADVEADKLKSSGYIYINIDDGWQGGYDDHGLPVVNSAKFASGINALTDYIHAKGLKFGIYSSPGPLTCAGFEATYQHEDQDAQSYADWGVDYVKYDWCSYHDIARQVTAQRYGELLPDGWVGKPWACAQGRGGSTPPSPDSFSGHTRLCPVSPLHPPRCPGSPLHPPSVRCTRGCPGPSAESTDGP